MRFPISNLGQTANTVAGYRNQLREYSKQEQFYRELAKTDPDYKGTADWYAGLRDEAQASLTRTIQQGLQQQGVSPQGYAPPGSNTGQAYQSYEMVPMTPNKLPSPLMNELKMSTDLGPIELPPEGWSPSRPPVATPPTTSRPSVATEGVTPDWHRVSTDVVPPVQTGTSTSQLPQTDSWNRGPAECAPPMVPAPGGGCMPGVATGYGGGGGGYGGLVNFGPSGGGMPISGEGLMGRRFPIVNL